MSTTALAVFGSDKWNAQVYDSLSFASRIAYVVKDRAQILNLAINLRRMVGKLEANLETLNLVIEGKVSPQSSEPTPPQQIQEAIDTLQKLSRVLSSIYEAAKRKRLTNNSLIAGPLSRLNKLSDDLSGIAEWAEMAFLHQQAVEDIFNRSRNEKEQGDIYDLSQVD